jgi:hypothetical protein
MFHMHLRNVMLLWFHGVSYVARLVCSAGQVLLPYGSSVYPSLKFPTVVEMSIYLLSQYLPHFQELESLDTCIYNHRHLLLNASSLRISLLLLWALLYYVPMLIISCSQELIHGSLLHLLWYSTAFSGLQPDIQNRLSFSSVLTVKWGKPILPGFPFYDLELYKQASSPLFYFPKEEPGIRELPSNYLQIW